MARNPDMAPFRYSQFNSCDQLRPRVIRYPKRVVRIGANTMATENHLSNFFNSTTLLGIAVIVVLLIAWQFMFLPTSEAASVGGLFRNVLYRRLSRHRAELPECPLMTQSGPESAG